MDKKTFKMIQKIALANTKMLESFTAYIEPGHFPIVYIYNTASKEVKNVSQSVVEKIDYTVLKFIAKEDTKRVSMFFDGGYGIIRVLNNEGLECDYTLLED